MNIPWLSFRTRSGCTSRCPPPPAAPSPFRIWRWAVVGPPPPVPALPPPIRIPATIRTSLPHFTLTGKINRLYIYVLNYCRLYGVAGHWCVPPRRSSSITQKSICDFCIQALESGSWSHLMWTYLKPDRTRHIVESGVVDRTNWIQIQSLLRWISIRIETSKY